jgi:hypothetical protein
MQMLLREEKADHPPDSMSRKVFRGGEYLSCLSEVESLEEKTRSYSFI